MKSPPFHLAENELEIVHKLLLERQRFTMKVITLMGVVLMVVALSGVGMYLFYNGTLSLGEPSMFTQPESEGSQQILPSRSEAKIVYGYLPYWTRTTAVFPEPITHVSFFSLTIQPDGSILDIPKERQDPGYRAFINGFLPQLRNKLFSSQHLELTLTMMDQNEIPVFLSDSKAHQKLVADIQTLLETAPLDGINIDIEYNGIVDAKLQDNFSSLVRMIRQATKEKDKDFLLTVAVYGDSGQIQRVTKIEDLAPNIDYLIVMAYDYHRRASPKSGPVSPLYGKVQGKWEADILNDLKKITDFIPSKQVLLGIPFYGYEWSVEDPENPQSFTLPKSGVTATYQRIQSLLSSGIATEYWDSTAFSPYLQYNEEGRTQRIYFENPRSLSYKLRLVNQAELGGIAIWALGYEGPHQDLFETIKKDLW